VADSSSHRTTSTDTNGRVTLAVLATKLDYLIQKVDGLCHLGDKRDERIGTLEKQQIVTTDRIQRIERAVKWAGGVAASVIAALIIALVMQRLGL